jgi:hypothetical protein
MNPLHLCSTLDEATQGLEVRTATTELEISQLREALKTQHYLGAGRPAGHVLWQGVYQTATEEGTPSLCAVLCWAGAALRLKDRDEWLDWDPLTQATAGARCALSCAQLRSLSDALENVPDARDPLMGAL